jgi:hypothetical protein
VNGSDPPSPEAGARPSRSLGRGCRISMRASERRVTAGKAVTLSGAIECPSGESAMGRQIAIYERQGGAGLAPDSASVVEIATTQRNGSYEVTSAALYANTVFRAHVGRHGARVIVKVAPSITLSAPAPPYARPPAASDRSRPHARIQTTFSGTVSPAVPGARVVLQVAYAASGEHWRSVALGHVGADGSFSIPHTFRVPGEASVRAIMHAGRHNAAAISEPVSYEVSNSQNPQLTIQTSSDPASYGQPITISGVAQEPNQPVTLMARSDGGAFGVAATTTTDANGNYAFTLQPLQDTSYEVADATTRSTVLFEGVRLGLVTASTQPTAQVGQQLTFSGTLTGAPEGQRVYLERGYASGLSFHVVAIGTVDAASQYQIVYTFNRPGAKVLRIKDRCDGRHRPSTSAPFTVTVTS